ncbi:hypothetical protein JCM17960_34320 [Magnetospira thiophila]
MSSDTSSPAESLFAEAEDRQRQGQAREALQCYLRAAQARPDWLEPLVRAGLLLQAGNKLPEASGFFARVLKARESLAPDDLEQWLSIAKVQLALDKGDQAIRIVTGLLARRPDWWDALQVRLKVLMKSGMAERALEEVTRFIETRSSASLHDQQDARDLQGRIRDVIGWQLWDKGYDLIFTDHEIEAGLHWLDRCGQMGYGMEKEIMRLFEINKRLIEPARNLGLETLADLCDRLQSRLALYEDSPDFETLWNCLQFPLDHQQLITDLTYNSMDDAYYGKVARRLSDAFLADAQAAPPCEPPAFPSLPPREERIRVGYLSVDFAPDFIIWRSYRNLFLLHRKEKFDVVIYFTNLPARRLVREMRAMGVTVRDCCLLDDDEIASIMKTDDLDILVDLNGYHPTSRPGPVARRPAPLQILLHSYGRPIYSPFHDYQFSDRILNPERVTDREHLAWLPSPCIAPWSIDQFERYIPNDELPSGPIRLSAPHQGNKLNPDSISAWFDILEATPGAVLHVRSVTDDVADIGKARGLFQRVVDSGWSDSWSDYMADLSKAHLILDSFPFTSSASGIECLWCGVPLITLNNGAQMARMMSNLLTACGFPELVTYNIEDYKRTAIALANDRARLADYRKRLVATRHDWGVFNAPLLVRRIEAGLEAIHQRRLDGLAPQSLDIPDVT